MSGVYSRVEDTVVSGDYSRVGVTVVSGDYSCVGSVCTGEGQRELVGTIGLC